MGGLANDTRSAYGLVIIASFGYTCLMFIWFSLPAYLSLIIDEIGLTGTQAGILVGAVPLTYIPLALFSGVVIDRVGPGRSLATGVLIYGVAQIGRSFALGFSSLLAFTLLIGVGATAITFGLPKLVSFLFPPDQTGLPSSIYLIGASVGSAGVFGVGRPLVGPMLGGWRSLFFWSGVVAVVYAVLWFTVAWQVGVDDPTSEHDLSFSVDSISQDLWFILTHRELQLIVIIGTMYLLINHGIQGWLPTVLESRGHSPARAGRTTSGFVIALAIGVLIVPAIADRYSARRAALVTCGSVTFLGIGGIMVGDASYLLFAGVVVTGIGVGGLSPLIRAIPPDLDGVGVRLTGTAMGFIFAVGELGGFFGPVLIGILYEVTGSYTPGLMILSTAGIIVALAGGALQRIRE